LTYLYYALKPLETSASLSLLSARMTAITGGKSQKSPQEQPNAKMSLRDANRKQKSVLSKNKTLINAICKVYSK
jgi:hypothetical protein